MKNLTPEMLEKAKAAKSAEELLALAKENEVEMTEEEAKTYFAQLNPKSGELDDDDLDNVAGGGCGSNDNYDETQAKIGDRVCISGGQCPVCGQKNPTGTVLDFGNVGVAWETWKLEFDCCGAIGDNYNGNGVGIFHGKDLRKI